VVFLFKRLPGKGVPREPVVKQRVADSKGGGKACRGWCEAKTAPWPVHKARWSRDSAAL